MKEYDRTGIRGCQYACREYVGMLRKHGIRVSMTESGDPKDNAQAERINNTMKNELLKGKVFRNITEVVAAVARAVDFYNNRRPHMSVGMRTPSEASGAAGDRDMMWTSYRHMAIKSRNNLEIPENSLPLETPDRYNNAKSTYISDTTRARYKSGKTRWKNYGELPKSR